LGALPAPQGSGAVNAGRFDLALKSQGGVWSACDAWWGLVGSLWRFCGRVLKSAARRKAAVGCSICILHTARLMTSTDRNDLMPAQEKLEWVTPKISQMVAEETAGSKPGNSGEPNSSPFSGPS